MKLVVIAVCIYKSICALLVILFQAGEVKCNTSQCPILPCLKNVTLTGQCCPQCLCETSHLNTFLKHNWLVSWSICTIACRDRGRVISYGRVYRPDACTQCICGVSNTWISLFALLVILFASSRTMHHYQHAQFSLVQMSVVLALQSCHAESAVLFVKVCRFCLYLQCMFYFYGCQIVHLMVMERLG